MFPGRSGDPLMTCRYDDPPSTTTSSAAMIKLPVPQVHPNDLETLISDRKVLRKIDRPVT